MFGNFQNMIRTASLGSVMLLTGQVHLPTASGQSALPVIGINVEIEAELYLEQLAPHIDFLQIELAAAVSSLFLGYDAFSYVEWRAQDSVSTAQEAHRLNLYVEEKSSPLGSEIRLRFVTEILGAFENDLSDESIEAFNPTIFGSIDPKHAQDQARLALEVADWMESHFDQTFQEELTDHFLRFVPLTAIDPSIAKMQIDTALNIISTAIDYREKDPDSGSKLKAIFNSTYIQDSTSSLAGETLPGYMYLRPLGNENTQLRVRVACIEDSERCFSYPGTDILSEAEIPAKWNNVRSILNDSNLINMQLFMEAYVKNYYPTTTGGIVHNP